MRFRRAVTPILALALASCTSTAPFQIASSRTRGYRASFGGQVRPDEVRPQLLFSTAEAVLASGYQYFRVIAYAESGQPTANISPRASASRQGQLCFEVLADPSPLENTYDSVQVIQQASPTLKRGLEPGPGRAQLRPQAPTPPGA
jgi:hypothetical protein